MRHFYIQFPNKGIDKTGVYKNYLLNRLNQAYPELTIDGIDTKETPFSYQYVGPNDILGIGNGYCSRCDVAGSIMNRYPKLERTYTPTYNLATEFQLAMKKLDDYYKMKKDYKPLYDFLLDDGTPVREYNNFIQVGYRLIPKYGSPAYFAKLNTEDRKAVNSIIVVVNKITNNNTYKLF